MTTQTQDEHKTNELEARRAQLKGKNGKEYWRSLKELANDEEFEELIKHEFPRQSGVLELLNRRDFLKVMGAALALAGMTACVPRQNELILPYVNPPEELIPAKSIYFASAMVQDGYAKGVLLETTMGRPIKVEGNPKHPESLGATDVFMQASILELYDPDRAQQITFKGAQKTWQDFTAAVGSLGAGAVRILTGPISSPSLVGQLSALLSQNSQAKWYQYSPLERVNATAGANAAFGQPYEAVYDFSKADVILSLDCDFLFMEPGHVRYARDFALRHQPVSNAGTMSRLYMVESSATITGSNADHRAAVKPSQVEAFARALANQLGISAGTSNVPVPAQDWLGPLANDLKKAGAGALVVAGMRQPPAVHALAHAMNQMLGSIGSTVTLVAPVVSAPGGTLTDLVKDLNSGAVDTLVIIEGNPVYTAFADLDFAAAMKKAKTSIYLAYYPDETAVVADWVVPATHYMEAWGDARAYEGTISLVQPVIEPLYGGKSVYDFIAALSGQADAKGYDLLRAFWKAQPQGQAGDFERNWKDWLSQGFIPGTAASAAANLPQVNTAAFGTPAAAPASGLEVVFEPDFTIWDGRFTNNAWLQELPKPLTKLTWDNAAIISIPTAEKLGLQDEQVVTLSLNGHTVEAPIYIQPGQPDDVVVLSLGYGRKAGGSLVIGQGFNAYAVRTAQAPWLASGLQMAKTGKTYQLVAAHEHWTMEGRDIIREATAEEYQANPNFAQEVEGVLHTPTLYGEYKYEGYAWGMSINLSSCIGCNACVIACQAENNIPTVGKAQTSNSREMHWLRIDRYYRGLTGNPKVSWMPVPCMHCEKAPCEPVCPVEATSHSAEGLNEMTYNRCVGTRYCSNNCPYKVRRFNFFNWNKDMPISERAMKNPDVTVRMRGVMEKCTYCVQRINETRIQAQVEGRQIRDGEVQTACMQACPTQAIIFGDINNPNAAVTQLKQTPLSYGLLAELGTQPRTTYLGKVTNPNPLIKEA